MFDRHELYEVFLGRSLKKAEAASPIQNLIEENSLLKEVSGPIGVIILAGGRGTRLGCLGPKGSVLFQGKSLFEHLLRKIDSKDISIAIMTSSENHDETKQFLEEHNWFGIDPQSIDFFSQSMAPTLSKEGEWLEKMTPSGNGALFSCFAKSPLLEKWKKKGILGINVLMIDNPKANPVDRKSLFLLQEGYDLVVKAVQKISPEEKVGLLGTRGGKLIVREYFEISEEEKIDWMWGNTGLFSASLSFFERAATLSLPWHLVQKENHYQFETFIFDAFSEAKRFAILECKRENCFLPIKSLQDLLF